MVMASQTIPLKFFNFISTEQSQQFKAFKLNYLGFLKTVSVVAILQYEFAWHMMLHYHSFA